MSDYFFYDLNKKMADLADKQTLAETARATPAKPAPSALRTQLNERDLGKHNNATTGFAALAKKTGGGEKGARIAGAQLAKMRAKGQVEESKKECPPMSHIKKMCQDGKSVAEICKIHPDCDQKELKQMVADCKKKLSEGVAKGSLNEGQYEMMMRNGQVKKFIAKDDADAKRIAAGHGAKSVIKLRGGVPVGKVAEQGVAEGMCSACDCNPCKCDSMDESALQAAFGKKKYGDQGMKALQKAGRDHAGDATMNKIRNRYDKYDESMGMTDEGNAFSGAVVKAKRDGIQPGEKIRVGGKQYELKEVDATPQNVDDPVSRPATKASAPGAPLKKTMPPKKPAMYPPQAIDEPVREADDSQDPAGPARRAAYALSYKLRNPKFDAALKKIEDKYTNDSMIVRMNSQGGKPDPTRIAGILQDLALQYKKDLEELVNYYQKYGGPTPAVQEGGVPMSPKQKKFAALAKPFDKITFADKIVGAKKEVDEMLGDVAASAMKKAVRGRNRDMEESFMDDDEPTSRKSSTGGRIDTSQPGRTIHRAVKGNYSGAGHDAGADDEPTGAVGRRKVGAGMGKKIGAKINRGTSKLMTDEDMIDPQDSGEYDREGEMAKDSIKTVVRHAQALEKILGDNDNLPEWVQSKLAKIENMMSAVDDYMQNQKDDDGSDDMEMDEERTAKRDNRAERAGKKVAKDIEYDEKKKDGIHGKRRGGEDNKAEQAGKKVTKDIEYDEKKDKKKKEVDETTTSGSVATGGTGGKGQNFGKGIYDSLNRQLENMISESMNINMSMNNDEHGGPRQSLTVTATDDDAVMLAGLLKMAGMGSGDEHIHAMTGDDSGMEAIHDMDHDHGEEPCPDCGMSDCGCDDQMMDEAYGNTDETKNHPDYPTDEVGTDDAMMYSGGMNGPKSTGQTTVPVISGQHDRMGHHGDHELRRMMEIAGLR